MRRVIISNISGFAGLPELRDIALLGSGRPSHPYVDGVPATPLMPDMLLLTPPGGEHWMPSE